MVSLLTEPQRKWTRLQPSFSHSSVTNCWLFICNAHLQQNERSGRATSGWSPQREGAAGRRVRVRRTLHQMHRGESSLYWTDSWHQASSVSSQPADSECVNVPAGVLPVKDCRLQPGVGDVQLQCVSEGDGGGHLQRSDSSPRRSHLQRHQLALSPHLHTGWHGDKNNQSESSNSCYLQPDII